MSMHIIHRTAVIALALAVAGCGSKSSESADAGESAGAASTQAATPASFDPCSLLTAEEATAITTDAVTRVERLDTGCRYHSKPDDGLSFDVYLTDGATQMNAVRNAGALLGGIGAAVGEKGGAGADAAALLKEDKTAAPRLGDEAVWGMNTTLAVRKGDAFIQVSPPIIHDPANHPGYPLVGVAEKREIAQKVAEKLLARLPG